MNDQGPSVNLDYQPSLFGRDVFEITLKIGIVPETEHVQVEIEVRECRGNQLLHLESHPHVSPWEAVNVLDEYFVKIALLAEELSGPF